MDRQLSTLLLFAALGRSSLALETASCAAGTTIGASLATIQFAEDTPRCGLGRLAQLVNTELITILTENFGGISTDSEDADLRALRAQNESFTALLLGVLPTTEAYTILRPDFVPAATTPLQDVNGFVWTAIRIARKAENYAESQAAIANLSNSAQNASAAGIGLLYHYMLDGTALIPDEAEDVIACVKERATSELVAAIASLFKEIYILLEATFNVQTQDDVKKYSSLIAAAHEEVLAFFNLEVTNKVSILRNIVIADYFNRTGIVTGLFDLQSASGNRFI